MDIDRWRSRLPVKRASDGELVGWMIDVDGTADDDLLVDVVNPVGQTVATSLTPDEAVDVLEAQGLSSLSAPCWARAPLPLTSTTDLRRPAAEWAWRRITLVQLDDTRVWIRPAYPGWSERLIEIPLPLPADDVLVNHPPAVDE